MKLAWLLLRFHAIDQLHHMTRAGTKKLTKFTVGTFRYVDTPAKAPLFTFGPPLIPALISPVNMN